MSSRFSAKTLADLALAEIGLDELASRLPSPVGRPDITAVAGALFGSRCRDLYAGFLHACEGPSAIAPLVLARPLIELAILVRWMRDDAEQRFKQWQAHSADMDTKAMRQAAEHLPRPVRDPFHIDQWSGLLAEKDSMAAKAREEANRESQDRVLPGLTEMIQAIGKRNKADAHALWQGYDLAFRSISPATHSDEASFRMGLTQYPDGSADYAERPTVEPDALRLIVASCVAYTTESAALMCGLDELASTALAIRAMLVVSSDTSDNRVQDAAADLETRSETE
jgi:hypothetical protein